MTAIEVSKNKFISFWVHTTNRCNLHCSYCYVAKNDSSMSRDVYEDIVNEAYKLKKDSYRLNFRIAGGEPLLVFKEWKKYVSELTKVGTIDIITNLSFIPRGFLKFISKYKLSLSISLDSLSFSKPYHNGKSSSKNVLRNINKIKKYGILTTITPNSLSSLDKLAEFIAPTQNFWRIGIDYFYKNKPSSDKVISKLRQVIDILYKNNYPVMEKFRLNKCDYNGLQTNGCGKFLYSIDINGDIYPCQTLIGKTKPIGHISDFQNSVKSNCIKNICKECSLSMICNSDCPLYNIGIRKEKVCRILKEIAVYIYKKEVDYA